MTWQGKSVLVTGAGGFIGSHLTERLVVLGAKTRAFVHYHSDGSWGWLDASPVKEEIEVIAGDIRDRECVTQAMKGVEVVFHLAALIAIPYSYQASESYVETNVLGTLNLLQVARDLRTSRIVHTSTSEVYGSARATPMDESHPLKAQSPYAASKIGADKLAESFFHSYGLPVVTVRPFNTFGPRQSARAIVPTIITQCLGQETVCLGHLHPTRDLNYVGDMVEGFLKAAQAKEALGRTFNLGSGQETQIGDLARRIAELAERNVRIEQSPERLRPEHSEVNRLVADATAARQVLGWTPSVSLEEGLRLTIEWMREHLERYRAGLYVL